MEGLNLLDINENSRDGLVDAIHRMEKDYKLSLKTLSKITKISLLLLESYTSGKIGYQEFQHSISRDDFDYLGDIVGMFAFKSGITEDERVKGIIEALTDFFDLSLETIAIYADLKFEDIQNFMKDQQSLSFEKKYKLSTAVIFLHFMFKRY
jgi:hypothetical protein